MEKIVNFLEIIMFPIKTLQKKEETKLDQRLNRGTYGTTVLPEFTETQMRIKNQYHNLRK